MINVRKGEIYFAKLNPVVGSEQGGIRPVVILQNNQGNICSPTTIIAPLTKVENNKHKLPTHIFITKKEFLKVDSLILLEQIRAIDKRRLINYLGSLSNDEVNKINKKLIKLLNIKEIKENGKKL